LTRSDFYFTTGDGVSGAGFGTANDIYQYHIDVSMDGETYMTALDQIENKIQRNTIFKELPPVKCRFVRLTMTNWPDTTPLAIIEFTVFGKPAESLPAEQPIPEVQL
jgi:hypothetical protein